MSQLAQNTHARVSDGPVVQRLAIVEAPHLEIAVLSIRGLDESPLAPSYTANTQFVFPLHGLHLLDDGREDILVDLNSAAVIPRHSVTRDRHPRAGDMSCLIVTPEPGMTEELWRIERGASTEGCLARPMTAKAQMSARLMTFSGMKAAQEELAVELVTGLEPSRGQSSPPLGGKPLRLVRAIKELLSEQLQPISLSEASAQVGVSATYLTTLFNQVEGMPLYRYHLRLRLAEALRHLGRSEDITALALDLGFSSHSHFSSAFRAHFGISPSRYRELSRTPCVGWSKPVRMFKPPRAA